MSSFLEIPVAMITDLACMSSSSSVVSWKLGPSLLAEMMFFSNILHPKIFAWLIPFFRIMSPFIAPGIPK